jgi:hypothetical protein
MESALMSRNVLVIEDDKDTVPPGGAPSPGRMMMRPPSVTVAEHMSKNIGMGCKDFRRAATDGQDDKQMNRREADTQWKN